MPWCLGTFVSLHTFSLSPAQRPSSAWSDAINTPIVVNTLDFVGFDTFGVNQHARYAIGAAAAKTPSQYPSLDRSL